MSAEAPKRQAGPRLQHVVAHVSDEHIPAQHIYDDVLVFGQELDALRHTHGKTGWVYVAVAHGQSVVEALKAAGS